MKISLKWVNDYVDVKDFLQEPEPLFEKLTAAGLEVEESFVGAEAFKNTVVGHIEKLGQHPDADKLTLCKVNVGTETLDIVCGAKNHKEGDKVCVAQVGAVLPGDFKIKKSKIRGVESFGMLCSKSELGLEDSAEKKSDGIYILPADAPVGESLAEYLGLDDVIVELNVTPNRADCLSHLGLAREISTLFDRPLKEQDLSFSTVDAEKDLVTLELQKKELCPRYMGNLVYGVKVQESPDWMKKRLEALDLKPINNVVDVTNYIMFDMGQPLHAFDADKIRGNKIIIDQAQKDEAFKGLDDKDYKLSGNELTIRDTEGVVALAGVIGGAGSAVSEKTQTVFLEAAHFIPSTVRKTSRALGIETDSAYRFSRGTDSKRVDQACKKALKLLAEVSGGRVCKSMQEAYPEEAQKIEIEITKEFLEERLGYSLSDSQIEEVFKKLSFEVSKSQEVWTLSPPSYRWDIFIKEDLVEEVARIVGYDQIPEILPLFSDRPQTEDVFYNNLNKLKDQMRGMAFHEAIHYNFYSGKEEMLWSEDFNQLLYSKEGSENVKILNPLSSDLSEMRKSIAPQMLSNFIKNLRLGNKEARLFELGKAHFKKESGFAEKNLLSLALWSEEDQETLLKEALQVIEKLFYLWKIKQYSFESLDKKDSMVVHPNYSSYLKAEGKRLGMVYSLHPALQQDQKVSGSFVGLELDLDLFLLGKPRPSKFKDFSRFPKVERDFSLLVDQDYNYAQIEKSLKKASKDLFSNLRLKEEYRGERVPEGKVSLTLSAEFQAKDKTIGEEELKTLQKSVMEVLKGFES